MCNKKVSWAYREIQCFPHFRLYTPSCLWVFATGLLKPMLLVGIYYYNLSTVTTDLANHSFRGILWAPSTTWESASVGVPGDGIHHHGSFLLAWLWCDNLLPPSSVSHPLKRGVTDFIGCTSKKISLFS